MNLKSDVTVLLLDGEQRASLATARSLISKGINVFVGSEKKSSLAGSTRNVKGQIQYTSPLDDPQGFLEDIQSAIKQFNIKMLLPITDLTMFLVLKNFPLFKPATIPLITFEKYIVASDKFNLMKLAEKVEVPTPATIFINHSRELDQYLSSLSYPVILKPMSSLVLYKEKVIRTSVKVLQSKDELIKEVNTNSAFKFPYMLQKPVIGQGIGIFTLFSSGKPLVVFAHRRVREKPPWGGVSVVSESIEPRQDAKHYAIKLLKALEWEGPAMVEFKMDEENGIPVLMEINARFWGSLQLAVNSGVDFPFMLYQLWNREYVPQINSYKKTRLRWFLGDLDNLYISLKSDTSKLPKEYHNKINVLITFIMEFFKDSKNEIFDLKDIKPSLYELKQYIINLLK